MSNQATISELFDLAMDAEKAAGKLYRGLEAKFAHYPEVAGFWKRYAAEEAEHVLWLERLRDRLSQEELSAPADSRALENARAALQFSVEDALGEIENLQDGYHAANELENSEMNAVFEFLITHFSYDEETQAFLKAQLKDHVTRLMTGFPAHFQSAMMRSSVDALD
jgi:rubrerythrin